MSRPISIGLDLGRKLRHQAVTIGADGVETGLPFTVRTEAGSLEEMLTRTGGSPGDCIVVMEPTGMAWLPVSAYLNWKGCEVYRVDTVRASQFRKFVSRTAKTDTIDARSIARLPAADPDGVYPLTLPDANQLALDRVCRHRYTLVRKLTRQKQQILDAIDVFIPGLPDALGKHTFGIPQRALLRRFMNPAEVLQLQTVGMKKSLQKSIREQTPDKLLESFVEAARGAESIWSPLRAAGQCPIDFQAAQNEINRRLDVLESQEKYILQVEQEMDRFARHLPTYEVLRGIPGIGPVVAPAVLAIVGDIRRFKNARGLVAYCGLAPRKNQSGQFDRKGQRMTKTGNAMLRKYLYIAADVARRSDIELAAFYERQIRKGKHHKAVVVAIAAKLARRIYSVLKRSVEEAKPQPYAFRDETGRHVTRKQARQQVQERYPSKHARAIEKQKQRKTDELKQTPGRTRSSGPPVDAPSKPTEELPLQLRPILQEIILRTNPHTAKQLLDDALSGDPARIQQLIRRLNAKPQVP